MSLDEWIAHGSVGVSSRTMWIVLKHLEVKNNRRGVYYDVPYDNDDFSRCYKFYKQCNLSESDLQKVVEVFPWWEPYIKRWNKLVELFEKGYGKQLELYDLIRTCEKESTQINYEYHANANQ